MSLTVSPYRNSTGNCRDERILSNKGCGNCTSKRNCRWCILCQSWTCEIAEETCRIQNWKMNMLKHWRWENKENENWNVQNMLMTISKKYAIMISKNLSFSTYHFLLTYTYLKHILVLRLFHLYANPNSIYHYHWSID